MVSNSFIPFVKDDKQIGKKGKSNKRWIVGGKLCFLLNHLGLIVSWDCDTDNVYDGSAFQHIVDDVKDQMIVFSDTGFEKIDWHPTNLYVNVVNGTLGCSLKQCYQC